MLYWRNKITKKFILKYVNSYIRLYYIFINLLIKHIAFEYIPIN